MLRFSTITFHFFIFTSITLNSHLTYSLETFNFDPNTLSGDAEVINGSINLIRPINSSKHGAIQSKNHFKFIKADPLSVSTDFAFSIKGSGGNLCFEIKKISRIGENVRITFRGDSVGVQVGGRVGKVMTFGEVFDSGEIFRCWVDYEASSKQIEVRVGKAGSERSYVPLVMYAVDLGEMWDGEEVFVGLSSSGSGNVGESVSVYSWKFRVRGVPKGMHSRPMIPESVVNGILEQKGEKKSSCHLGVIMFGCAALVAVVLLSFWEMFVRRYECDSVTPAEIITNPVDFKYQKIGVDVENVFEDVIKEKVVV
ncbi:uncharacterized protein LOC141692344 [Apium graveolens]|uniref:uncharacterized protein LOC141692344 n=1 Tax=Apium graveolens TaxID=4045 RepID=UPI003D7AE05C